MQFCMITHSSLLELISCSKSQILKMQDGSWRLFWIRLIPITLQLLTNFNVSMVMCVNNHNDIYGAVIMAQSHCESSCGHSMNADWVLGDRHPSDQASWIGFWVCDNWQLSSTFTIVIYFYCWAWMLIRILSSHGGWKALIVLGY